MFKIFKDEVYSMYYIELADKFGICAYTVFYHDEEPEIALVKMNGHFFNQYNIRLHLNLAQPTDKLQA